MSHAPHSGDADRARLRFWRSLDELDGAAIAAVPADNLAPMLERRDFLKVMAASLALSTAGCGRAPLEKIVPYRDGPPQDGYGKPVFYASAIVRDGYGCGVLVETNMGRPTKVEGNPSHPASLGATDLFAQAAVLDLWDPDRATAIMWGNAIDTWSRFVTDLQAQLRRSPDGDGLFILTETVTSPTLHDQLAAILARHPRARWHQYQPLARGHVYEGARLAWGEPLEPCYRYGDARVVVALDADIVGTMPGCVRYARDIADARRSDRAAQMSRLHVAEGTPSLTGALADHRCVVRCSDIEALTQRLAVRLGVGAPPPAAAALRAPDDAKAGEDAWLDNVANDLAGNRGHAIVVAGDRQPAAVHALVHAINHALANDRLVELREPVAFDTGDGVESLRALVDAMKSGRATTLLILGGNPVYNAPRDLDFAAALGHVRWSAHHALYRDETSAGCSWHVAAAHVLEDWGDVRAFDGSVTIQQPCIAPLYDGKSAHQMLSVLLDGNPRPAHDVVRDFWQQRHPQDFDAFWRNALQRGVVDEPSPPARTHVLHAMPAPATPERASTGIELVLAADPTLGDGRHANNAWLQELPKPITTLTWDNAALVSPDFAHAHDLANEDLVELRTRDGRALRAPVWIVPGHAGDSVTLHLGFGRSRAGSVGNGVGVDAYALFDSATRGVVSDIQMHKVDGRHRLAAAQTHGRMEGRDLVRIVTRDDATRCASGGCEPAHAHDPRQSLYPDFPYAGYKWGMSIDQNRCIGCAACTIACQAENNIPVVGREEVLRGREMHWIRVDRYYAGSRDAPRMLFQPVPCMQCEHAPCEEVCPVEASVHDAEGLNVQVYNRCVGTRFCSNNCPYKVRRFNWLAYTRESPSLDAQRNPEVTVRMRGVMEKCTYCIQRIERARIDADRSDRRVADGEVVTACQAVCPTRAIVFGDLNDPRSEVNTRKASPLDYALLAELNTRPRTTYLPRVTNAMRSEAPGTTPGAAATPAAAATPGVAAPAAESSAKDAHGR
jgi:Fe-S-cluster-containing dehydrogenase component